MKSSRRVIRWRTRLALLLLVFSVGPLASLSWFATNTMEVSAREASLESLSALAAAKAEAVDQFTDYRRGDVERLATLVAPGVKSLRDAEAAASQVAPPVDEPEEVELPPLQDAEEIGKPLPPPSGSAVPQAPASGVPSADPTAPAPESPPVRVAPSEPVTAAQVDKARAELKQTLGLLLWDQSSIEELLVIDVEGRVVAGTYDKHEGRTATSLEYFTQGLKATFVQPVFRSPITENLTMVIATPIRGESGTDLGVLAVRLNLTRFFLLIGDTTGLGKSGETVVGKRLDEEIVFMAPTRHDENAALTRKIPRGSKDAVPLQEAARGETGQGVWTDYRGVKVFAAWQNVPSLGWGLVVKMDQEEAMRSVIDARLTILVLAIILGMVATLSAFVVARSLVRPLQDLRDATEKISKGDFAIEMKDYPADEIGELADSFGRMVAAIKFFRERYQKGSLDEPDADEEIAE